MTKPGLPARIAASILLTRVIDDQRSLDGLLDTRHGPVQFRQLPVDDKALARAIVTAALRHRGEIEYCLGRLLSRKLPKGARHLLHTLHCAAAQILFLDVPDSAAVDLAVTALSDEKRSTRFASLANAVLRRLSREKTSLLAGKSEQEIAELNVAPWLARRMRKDWGRKQSAAIAYQHMLAPMIDVTVRKDPENWAECLGGRLLFGHSVRVDRKGNVDSWPGYEDGGWWVQDAAASLPVHLFGDVNGKTALDLCAAPGGKTAQLAAAGALVTALDSSAPRLHRLQNNMHRLHLDVRCVEADMMDWEAKEQFDLVLLDAPCSSTGTIRRHPDVQWTKTAQSIEQLALLQQEMMIRAVEYVKPGGTLIYSNCSLDRAEGEDVVARLNQQDWPLEIAQVLPEEVFGHTEWINRQGTVRTLPCHLQEFGLSTGTADNDRRLTGLDGFFCARFRRRV